MGVPGWGRRGQAALRGWVRASEVWGSGRLSFLTERDPQARHLRALGGDSPGPRVPDARAPVPPPRGPAHDSRHSPETPPSTSELRTAASRQPVLRLEAPPPTAALPTPHPDAGSPRALAGSSPGTPPRRAEAAHWTQLSQSELLLLRGGPGSAGSCRGRRKRSVATAGPW